MRRLIMALGIAIAVPAAGHAASIITDGNVSLGVNDYGHLNVGGGVPDIAGTSAVGVRWIDGDGVQYESTSHGCLCEGWGIAVNGTTSGWASVDNGGTSNLTVDSFTSTATTAKSVVSLGSTGVKITHDFALADETDDLYRVHVTVANTSASAVTGVVYRRAMDWDASPTPFNEYVSIGGTATTSLLLSSSDNGFVNVNPFVSNSSDLASCGLTSDFTACGPADHGAAFDFALGDLAAGESYEFDIYYGGAANKAEALAALGAVAAELYSFGWSNLDPSQSGMSESGLKTPTFIFAFSGVGGSVVVPPEEPAPVPLPAAAFLLMGAVGSLVAVRRKRAA